MDNNSSVSFPDYMDLSDNDTTTINGSNWYMVNTSAAPLPIGDYDFVIDGISWANVTNRSVVYHVVTFSNDSFANRTYGGEFVGASLSYNWYFLLLLIFVSAGVLGNTLVCLAICFERRLQNVTNYFLLSLAVADLLVSLVVMPFGIVVGFLGYWPFGAELCNIAVTCDVLACSCSIMHMCFISIGRYLGIRNPLKTRHSSKKAVMVKIVLVWLLSMFITSPITILGMVDYENILFDKLCCINNRFFRIVGSLFAFYIPMVFMVVSYVLTVQLLREQSKFGENLPCTRRAQLSCRRGNPPPSIVTSNGRRSLRGEAMAWNNNGHIAYQPRISTCDRGTQTSLSLSNVNRRARIRSMRLNLPKGTSNINFKFFVGRRRSPVMTNTVVNEQKASKVLGIVFSTFVICWAPFFILNTVLALCPSCYVSDNIIDTCLWLGYASSTINPIIYTIFNRTFKEAFIKLLLCRCVFPKRYSHTRIYRYVDNLVQTPSRNSVLGKATFSPTDGQESIC